MPTEALRRKYAERWLGKLNKKESALNIDASALSEQISKKTDGFSYAFLQELFVSAGTKAINLSDVNAPVDFATILLNYADELRPQIKAAETVIEPAVTTKVGTFLTWFPPNVINQLLFAWASFSTIAAFLLLFYPLHR